jgi:alpha-beta hydrolase superfamily lysophospholipase
MDGSLNDAKSTTVMSPSASNMQSITFDGLLGWLHTPIGPSAGTGVVLVSPLGRDARCAHMPMRLFADQLAAAGFPTIRYDHRGTGDSLDLPDEESDALPEWMNGVQSAVDVLRARVGVRQIVLGGVRLGATLAAVSPAQVDGLLLLAPVLNGRSWLKRLRFTARIAKDGSHPHNENQPLDTDGLWLSSETASGVVRIDLTRAEPPRLPVFVASQNQLVGAYAAGLSCAGAALRTTDFPGFNDLFLEPSINNPPNVVFERAISWIQETFERSDPVPLSEPRAQMGEPALRPRDAVERSISFGSGLRGVLCEPEHEVDNAPSVLFCNAGGDPRAGSGGFTRQAVRRLAAQGIASLRFDFAGLGDSDWLGGADRCHVFETSRDADMEAAVDILAGRGHHAIITVGVCSGAYHALQAAWKNHKVTGVFAVSPVKIVWRRGDSVTFSRDEYRLPLKVYVKAIFDPEARERAAQRELSVTALLLSLANRFGSRISGWMTRRGRRSPLAEMRRFTQRGGRASFVMGVNDTSIEEIESFFGAKGAELTRLQDVSVEIIPDLDHGLAYRASREIAMKRLVEWLAPQRAPIA